MFKKGIKMFRVYNKAEDIPISWDDIVKDNIFLKKGSLQLLEKLNPSHQSYHINEDKKIVFVAYKINLNLLTFTKTLSFKFPVNIIGIPMSVSRCGYTLGSKGNDLIEHLKSKRGFYIILNSIDHLDLAKGLTFPTYKLKISWCSFNEYLDSMRSHYRYRLKKALVKFNSVKAEELLQRDFDERLYSLYEAVYINSKGKLEKMTIDFFRTYPSKIIRFTAEGEPIAFVQMVENQKELIFLFGGINYSLNQKYDLYINILLFVINYGIKNGFESIELGQTADEIKTKLGAVKNTKFMYIHHNNFLIRLLLNNFISRFSHLEYNVFHNVFKEEEDEGPFGKMS
jgi:hypothetical protein